MRMKNIWNTKKPWCRILSVGMSLALTVTLLSGCGTAGQQVENIAETKTEISEELQEEVRSESSKLAENSEQVEEAVARLLEETENASVTECEKTVQTLKEQLEMVEAQTKDWLSSQQKVTDYLGKDAAEILTKRQETFEQEIAESETAAQETLTDIQCALSANDMDTAAAKTEQLKALLVEQEEPKVYGETLPNEVEVREAADEEYVAVETPQISEKREETAENRETLLVAEGDTALNERITEKAEELETPLAVYNYLKNNIGYEYYYGSRKGASGTLDALAGNDLDQASLLIAMLRYLGYPAEYVRGDILLTEEQALSLTGADTFSHAADVLAANGTPVTRLIREDEIIYIRMEHVWVRTCVPYTDYRGAGNANGDSVWINLDTSIKEYETVDNIYDTLDEQGFTQEIEEVTTSGDASQVESLLEQWEEKLQSEDLSGTYARKRVIRQETLSYLPLSLQYMVEKEDKTFVQVADSEKDSVSFEVNGAVLASFTAVELQGRNILLSYRPASSEDEEIYDSYGSIFDIPAYAVYMKPVLLVDGEVVAEGETELAATLGTTQTFTMTIHSGGRDNIVENDITIGAMYAVTLDSQNITSEELQSVYDETAALKDSVTEENVYSEEYLGKLLSLAGKLYFAQVDIADTMAAEMYDAAVTRSLSEGITGYEVQTSSLYGNITSLSEGTLYIDVDMDSHSVVSLTGDENVPREYMMSVGMIGSAYESNVWEQMTGKESISTINIFSEAQEENKELLVIGKENLSVEIEKLNTDEITKQTIINAVNSGKVVTIPTEDVTMGNWHGIGYIITNPETGAGSYMISGGLNGGATCDPIDAGFIVSEMYLSYTLVATMESLISFVEILSCELLFGGFWETIFGVVGMIYMLKNVIDNCKHLANIMQLYYDYILDDSDENALAFLLEMKNIFMDKFFVILARDTGVDYLKYLYTWIYQGGSLY
jgi:hypothetical protein